MFQKTLLKTLVLVAAGVFFPHEELLEFSYISCPTASRAPRANEGELAREERNREENLKMERLRKPTK